MSRNAKATTARDTPSPTATAGGHGYDSSEMNVTKEIAFEDAIVDWLVTTGGYTTGLPTHYDPAFALDTAELFTFIGATQADTWEDLVKRNGGDPDLAQRRFTERLAKQIDERGTIDVLRHGVEDLGVPIRLAYFRPASGLNADLQRKYDANRLTVTRQLHYAPEHANALDLVLFVNGLPVATAELKNPLTHQTVEHAMAQFRTDRDPRDALLGRRAIVHFAVDPGLVMMTTKLENKATRFLPFNRAGGHDRHGRRGRRHQRRLAGVRLGRRPRGDAPDDGRPSSRKRSVPSTPRSRGGRPTGTAPPLGRSSWAAGRSPRSAPGVGAPAEGRSPSTPGRCSPQRTC